MRGQISAKCDAIYCESLPKVAGEVRAIEVAHRSQNAMGAVSGRQRRVRCEDGCGRMGKRDDADDDIDRKDQVEDPSAW